MSDERRIREVPVPLMTAPALPARNLIERAKSLIPDIERLQEATYDLLRADQAEYAREQDAVLPLWSVAHWFKDGSWKVNWTNCANLYIYSGLEYKEIADLSGISQRTLESKGAKYGWRQAQRTLKVMQESAAVPDLKDLEEDLRRKTISDFLAQSGFEVARHAMQALLQNVDKVEPRDVGALLKVATQLLSMGTGMPSQYTHSDVANPLASQAQTTVQVLNITNEKALEELLDDLRERAKALEAEGIIKR